MMDTYEQLGTEIGQLVDCKNAAYGSSFAKCGDFLRLLFPQGIPPHRLEDALLLARIFDKQMRIATDQDAFGETPFADIAGYGLLGARRHKERQQAWQGNASGTNASARQRHSPVLRTRPQTSRLQRAKAGRTRRRSRSLQTAPAQALR